MQPLNRAVCAIFLTLAIYVTVDARPHDVLKGAGIMTGLAQQGNAPIFITASTAAVDQSAPNLLLRHAVIRNNSNVGVTGYKLGWILVFRDKDRKPEVHSQSNYNEIWIAPHGKVELGQPMEQDDLTDNYSLLPPVTASPNLRAIKYFVASVRFADKSTYRENAKKLAAGELAIVLAQE